MAPNKVSVKYFADGSTRNQVFKKRTQGMKKKADELSVLCGVQVFLMVLPEGAPSSKMQVWPSLPEAMAMVDRLKAMPEVDRRRKKMDGEGYVRERVGRAKEQLCKAERDNLQRETTLRIHDAMAGRRQNLKGLTVEQLVSIGWRMETLTKKIKDRIAYRGGQQQAGVKADLLPYAGNVSNVDADLDLQRGWVNEVVKAGWDLGTEACSGGSGSYGSVGAGGDVMQLSNMDGGPAWVDRGIYFSSV